MRWLAQLVTQSDPVQIAPAKFVFPIDRTCGRPMSRALERLPIKLHQLLSFPRMRESRAAALPVPLDRRIRGDDTDGAGST